MRLFTAINFGGGVKEELDAHCRELKKYTAKASFTGKNNFHMTLVFIGECNSAQADSVIAAAEKSAQEIKDVYAGKTPGTVQVTIAGLGSFPRAGEDLVWAGLSSNPRDIFSDLTRRLAVNIVTRGIEIKASDKKFTPHITLARRVIFREITRNLAEIAFPPICTEVKSLCVMESAQERRYTGGSYHTKLVYTPIYQADFL